MTPKARPIPGIATPIRIAGSHQVPSRGQAAGAVHAGGDATTTTTTSTDSARIGTTTTTTAATGSHTSTTTTTTSTDSARVGTTTTTTTAATGSHTTTTTTADALLSPQTTLSPQAQSVLQANRDGVRELIAAVKAGERDEVKNILARVGLLNHPLEKGATALHLAARAGHTEIVHDLIRLGANAYIPSTAGMTPLHEAAKAGHAHTVTCLLDFRIDPDPTEYTEDATPLHLALKHNREEVVEVLLARGANVHAQTSEGASAFYVATTADRLKMAGWLLARGADIAHRSPYGFSPFHSACANASLAFVEWLLAQPRILEYNGLQRTRADVLNMCGRTGLAPMHIAAAHGRKDILEFLMQQPGVNLKARDESGMSVLSYAALCQGQEAHIKSLCIGLGKEKTEKLLATADRWGDTPLSKALDADLPASTLRLLQPKTKAAPVTLRPTHYKRGWCIVGDDMKSWDKDAIVKIAAQAQIEIRHHGDGFTAVKWKELQELDIQSDDFVIFKCHCGWDNMQKRVTASLSKGESVPVTTIARWLFSKGVQKALFLGCQIAKAAAPLQRRFAFDPGFPQPDTGRQGFKGLEYSFSGREDRTLELINSHTAIHWVHALVATRNGAPLPEVNLKGRTPLHFAAETGRATLVTMLLRNQADIEAADQRASTPLHAAIAQKRVAVVRVLLHAGANVNAKMIKGGMPLDLAHGMDEVDIIKLLEDRRAKRKGFLETVLDL